MHDLMHDLASLMAGKSIKILDQSAYKFERTTRGSRLDRDLESAIEKVRHVFVDSNYNFSTLLFKQKKMCTFILSESKKLSSSESDDILSYFKLSRALNLKIENKFKTLPNSFDKLKHLRYFDLSQNDSIKELPNSIAVLYNLLTLILSHCSNLVSLPPDIQNLINLRHLEIDGCFSLIHMPCGIGELTSLQTLDRFVVGENKSIESGGLGELSKLNNLCGRLTIEFRSIKVTTESSAAQYLKDKEHLVSLSFYWSYCQETMEHAKEPFKRLEPPQNIKSIQVGDYPGETFPNWLSLLTNLVRLELSTCMKCKFLPPLHYLSSLQELVLRNLPALEYVSDWDMNRNEEDDCLSTSSKSLTVSFFPSLRRLVIHQCPNLKEWWGRGRENSGSEVVEPLSFSKLSELIINHCPLLTSMPLFPYIEDLFLHKTSSKLVQDRITMKLKSDSDGVAASSSASSSSPSALSKLNDLTIQKAGNLESIPEGISNLKSLQRLTIFSCPDLTSLPEGIGSLSLLTYLTIEYCHSLISIPRGIGSLPSLEYVNGRNLAEIPKDKLAEYLLQTNNTY